MIKKIFDELANEPGTNNKIAILKKYSDNKLLSRVFYLANSKRIKFYIKQIPAYKTTSSPAYSLEQACKMLGKLSNRELTGHEGIDYLSDILSNLKKDDAYIIERIIDKDCKIGTGTSLINKIFPKLIEETPYMGAKSYDEDLAKKIFNKGSNGYSDVKMDGRYANCIIRSGEVELESRGGEPTILPGAKFLLELAKCKTDCVLNGELTIDKIPRYESNGIVASLVSIGNKILAGDDVKKEISKFESKHMKYQTALDSIRYTVWDTITVDEYFDQKSSTQYSDRRANLQSILNSFKPGMVSMIESKLVKTYKEAMDHFKKILESGQEGTILKACNGTWKDGKPNWQIKMKRLDNYDLKIVGFNYGTKGSKNEHLISSLDVQTECGKLKTSPAGINEETMKYITKNQSALLGTIVEVQCCGLSQDSKGNYALLHPAFIKFRDDKNVANTLKECEQINSMISSL